ncbi:hypothetical protein F5877DRAFT_80658 [Lentinula edodes]|nr:hypothetical protein F5877DRAFT_80658 [Lentinula edodes]
MSQQHTSKPGTYFAANARRTIPCTNALKLTRSPPAPLRFACSTQYQHDLDSQQNDGCGKENHPSAYLKQVEPPRTQMLKTGPAPLKQWLAMYHVPKHPIPQDFVSASSGDNACTPVAQRFTVPVLSYQSTLSNSRQGCSASMSATQNPKTSSIPSSTQPHVYRTVPLGGSIGYAARATHTQASADANLDPRNSTPIRSFRASESQLSTSVVRPNASGANGTLQDHDQSYLATACPPPSPEVQCFVSPEAYIPLITGNTASSTISYAPGRLQYSPHTGARSNGHSNGTPAAVESVAQFSTDEGITDNTLTPITPIQASVSTQQESQEPFAHSISNGLPKAHYERIGSRPRGSSLNEHAAPFIPGQGLLSTPLSPPCLKENVLDLNSGFEAPDEDFDNDVEHFLDAVVNLENIVQESILPEPIAHEDITTYYRGLVRQYLLPLLNSADTTRSAEGWISWLEFEENSPAALVCLSRYLTVSLCKGLIDHEIRERFGADLFSASGLVVQRLLKLNIPPGITGSNLLLFLQIGRSLLEDSPHQARITIIFELLTAAGKDICGSSNAR